MTVNLTIKERIVCTAHDLFYQNGIRATGIDRIIQQAGITKVTFYRYFPSKDDLIFEYLSYRHKRWISWFKESIEGHKPSGNRLDVLVPIFKSWFDNPDFRGCAFINIAAELGQLDKRAIALCKEHKDEMKHIISDLMERSNDHLLNLNAICIAIDGAIVTSQIYGSSEASLNGLTQIIKHINHRN